MRGLFPFLLGVAVTIGGAYVRDTMFASSDKPFVNWEVVKDSTQGGVDFARAQWDRWTK